MTASSRRVAVIGANGQLGHDACAAFADAGYVVISWTHADIEITDAASVATAFERDRPAVVVNTAAMHHVDQCEADPTRAFAVNVTGPQHVARAADQHQAKLLHVSTDYVFDGRKTTPYTEYDLPRPLNMYGNTKLAGEYVVLASPGPHVVIRSSGLYGTEPCRAKGGLNFVRLMLKLARERGEVKVVTDETVTPTWTHDLAHQLVAIAASDMTGVVHATCQGACSWYEFASAIFTLAHQPVQLYPAQYSDFPAKVQRPHYSVLENSRLRQAGIDVMPDWRTSLSGYLAAAGKLRALHDQPVSAIV